MKTPALSVIMPVYNAEKYVGEAIKSVLNQTYTDFEFIIINDGSTDLSLEIALSFTDSRIKIIRNEKNIGLINSLNKAIIIAKGEFIARMDADDICLPYRFEKQINFLNSNSNIGVVGSNYIFIDHFGVKQNQTNLPNDNIYISWLLFFSVPIAHPTVMMRASILNFTNGYDSLIVTASREKYSAEDYNLWVRLLDFTTFANIEAPLLLYRVHDNNMSYVNNTETILNGILIDYELIKKRLKIDIDIRIVECLWFLNFINIKEIIQTIHLIIDLLLYHFNKYGKSLIVISDGFNRINSICLDNRKIIESARSYDIREISRLLFQFYLAFNNEEKGLNKTFSLLFFKMSNFSFRKEIKLKFLIISLRFNLERLVGKNYQLSRLNLKFLSHQNLVKEKFTSIFYYNSFLGSDSISGPGSDLTQTEVIRKEIPKLFDKFKIKSFIDAPCGDFFWMQHVNLDSIKYIGIDIVKELIRENTRKFKNSNRKFVCKNIITDKLAEGELILIRDCWVHLSYKDIFSCIDNLKKNKIKYLLTTSFTNRSSNKELEGIWRPLNLEIAPFNFPKPIEAINENCTEDDGIYHDKSLLLWETEKLPDL